MNGCLSLERRSRSPENNLDYVRLMLTVELVKHVVTVVGITQDFILCYRLHS
jgi:hypothetical protein